METENRSSEQKRSSFIETARRAQLIECAIETLATEGYAQASLAHIAQRAHVSKSVISYYFDSKDELLKQVVIEVFNGAGAYIGPRVGAQTGSAAQLRAYIEAHIEYISQHLNQMMALAEIGLNARNADGKPPLAGLEGEPALGPLIRLLRHGQETGEFRDFDAHVVAITIRRAIDGTSRLLIGHPDLDVGHYTRELVTIFEYATRTWETEA
jgi:TetR/AcrR family transcriptional regulator, fatty acid metabolism regulator protein